MNIIDVGENVSGERVVVSDFEIEEPNCMNGVPWISYVDNGEEHNDWCTGCGWRFRVI